MADRTPENNLLIPELSNVEFWARGARGVVYRGTYRGILVAIKIKVGESASVGAIQREVCGLRRVNKWGIGPRLLAEGEGYVMTQFEHGLDIRQFENPLALTTTSSELVFIVLIV